ncbi:MAG: amidase [Elainellaceae cyanobacterium]
MVATSIDLSYLSIREASTLFRKGELSPVELTQYHLKRIEQFQPSVRAYTTVTNDIALQEAKAAEAAIRQGDPRPLLGIPVAYKDIYLTEGVRTTAGSAVHASWVPGFTATTVAKLHDAGVVMLGKLATHEFAFGLSTEDHPFPPARNPWNLDYIPGGSSSGSGAALAAGLAIGTLGTDTGGSIRWPGIACGIAALKPTYGRCSRHGVVTLSWSLDHTGPMARNCEDIAFMLNALAGYDPKDPASASVPTEDYTAKLTTNLKDVKLGVLRSWYEQASDPEVVAAIDAAIDLLKSLGAEIQVVEIPNIHLLDVNRVILLSEAYAFHAQNLTETPELYPDGLRDRLLTGKLFSAYEYIQAQRARQILKSEVEALLKDVDLLISPTWGTTAITFENAYQMMMRGPGVYFTPLYNMTGSPALSVPCGFGSNGMPIGLQIAGRAFDEATVLQVGYAYEQAAGWFDRRPIL